MVKESFKKEGGRPKDSPRKSKHGSSSSSSSGSKPVKKEVGVKREDDVDALPKEKRKPGQKYPTPTPGQADRVFYETLLKQKPESHMAQDWCLFYGVCGAPEADVLYKSVCKRKGVQPSSTAPPLNSSPPKAKRPSSTGGGKSRPRSSLPKDIEADIGFAGSSVFEGVGTSGF